MILIVKYLMKRWNLSLCNLNPLPLVFFHAAPWEEKGAIPFIVTLQVLEFCDKITPLTILFLRADEPPQGNTVFQQNTTSANQGLQE